MKRLAASILFTFGLIFSRAAPASAADRAPEDLAFPIQRVTLDNGLRVVMAPEPGATRIGLSLVYDVGSRHEERGRTGFAHYFEHMMFQGSANVDKGEMARLISGRGGTLGGGTGPDVTQYYSTVPASELPLALWLEADRMKALDVTETNFENQRLVVQEEVRGGLNSPYTTASIRLSELVFQGYWPYEHPTGGSLADIDAAKFLEVKAFHARHYGPNNAVLALAGGFDPEEAISLVRRYFGSIPRIQRPPYTDPPLPEQTALRSSALKDDFARAPAVFIGVAGPRIRDPDHPALKLASIALGDGESSRLHRRLVDKGLAVEAAAEWEVLVSGPHMLTLREKLVSGGAIPEARRALESELDAIGKAPLSTSELERARRKSLLDLLLSLESFMGRAAFLSVFELYFGDARLLLEEAPRHRAVTAEDVRRVAARYLAPARRSVVEVTPKAEVKP
jgi:zinc protease